jgi:hypothetical protein
VSAGSRAETAANDAVRAVVLAKEAQQAAQQAAQIAEQLAPPDPHELIVRELASHERTGLLNIGPKRHRWSELQAFDEQLVEIERRREELRREISQLMGERNNEPLRLSAALDSWLMSGQRGDRPSSQVTQLDQQIADLEAEFGATGIAHDRLLAERAVHVEKNRKRMLGDMREEVEAAASEYRALIDQLEETRRELLELRATEVWTAIYPSETLASEPSTQSLVGAKKSLQAPLLPGLESGLVASSVFALLRADVRFCESVATTEQAALEQGTTVGRLRKSDARWLDNSKVDLVGPAFASTWGGSDEEKAEAQRVRDYQEQTRLRMEGSE